jgi:hypothetical protein
MGFMGFMGFMGLMGLMGRMRFVGFWLLGWRFLKNSMI